MSVQPDELGKLIFSASTALAGILVGALFVVHGIAESKKSGSLRASAYYRKLLFALCTVTTFPVVTMGLSLLFLFDGVALSWVLGFFALSAFGLLLSIILLFIGWI